MKTQDGTWKLGDGKWQGRADTPLPAAAPQIIPVRNAAARWVHRAISLWLGVFVMMMLFGLSVGHAQSYSIDWYKIAGGGGASTGATYQVTGTIGQPDASGAMSGGNYSLTGGFWSLIAVVQTAGVPYLIIVPNGPKSVKVMWPNTGSYTLQQNANLALANGWATSGYTVTTANGTNSITITPPTGNLFFRLSEP